MQNVTWYCIWAENYSFFVFNSIILNKVLTSKMELSVFVFRSEIGEKKVFIQRCCLFKSPKAPLNHESIDIVASSPDWGWCFHRAVGSYQFVWSRTGFWCLHLILIMCLIQKCWKHLPIPVDDTPASYSHSFKVYGIWHTSVEFPL